MSTPRTSPPSRRTWPPPPDRHGPARRHGGTGSRTGVPRTRSSGTEGQPIAKRNLIFSVLSEHIGFSVWSLWSVIVLFLGPEYGIDPAGKFLLTALPTLAGAAVGCPYTFAVATFGGRNWTIVSAAAAADPDHPDRDLPRAGRLLHTLLIMATTAGVGGGNFASSMTNINAYYPQRLKGWALGINAGGGNLGVPVVQLIGLLILATVGAVPAAARRHLHPADHHRPGRRFRAAR